MHAGHILDILDPSPCLYIYDYSGFRSNYQCVVAIYAIMPLENKCRDVATCEGH